MNHLFSSFKKIIKPIFRREITSIRQLAICKILVWGGCLINQIRFIRLRSIAKQKLQKLKDNRAESVFVFANGPSLNDLDFNKIKSLVDEKKFDLITVNSFASKGIKKYNIKPSVAVFSDPAHYTGTNGNKILPQFQEDIQAINDHKISALVPDRYFMDNQFNYGIPYCSSHNPYGNNVENILKPLGFYGVTAFVAISAAIHLGYKNIYICGYDNSYFKDFKVDQDNRRVLQDVHFYDTKKSAERFMSPDQYGPISDIFLDFARHFKYLEKINRLKPAQVNIFNIALSTYTDAFPRCFTLDLYNKPPETNINDNL